MNELTRLSDEELLGATQRCVAEEREVTVRLLKHLEEVDRRRLYLAKGYPSLFEFVRDWLKLSEGSAYRRIAGMKLLREAPALEEKISSGELPLTTAARIQTAFAAEPPAERIKMAETCAGMSTREVERTIAEKQPDELREYTRWLSGDQVRMTIHLDKEAFVSLNELKAIRAHAPGSKTFGGVITDLIGLGHQEWNPQRRSVSPAPEFKWLTQQYIKRERPADGSLC